LTILYGDALKEIEKNKLVREKLVNGHKSPFSVYIDITVGKVGFLRFLLYEFLTTLFGPMPGGVGLFLRKKFYPVLFKKVGNGLIIGRNVVIRHPHKIEFGNNVTVDDNCLIDGRGADSKGVILEDNVIINRNCMIQSKSGSIRIGKRTTIGSNSVIVSMDGVELEDDVLIAGSCDISAGSYHFEDIDKPVMNQPLYTKGPIRIGKNAWLGTRVTVLDGVNIGVGAVIGAGALVIKDVPQNTVSVGVPARVIKDRSQIQLDSN
jgi:acetyltransferase-like isoleucine patch superfamily enzyme